MDEKDTKQLAHALVEEMKEVFPTAEMVQAGFKSTASKADLTSAIKTVREDMHGMRQEMNTRFDKIDRDMQTVIHLKKLDEEMTAVYKRLRVLETRAEVGAK